jgi:hypothetical protein
MSLAAGLWGDGCKADDPCATSQSKASTPASSIKEWWSGGVSERACNLQCDVEVAPLLHMRHA